MASTVVAKPPAAVPASRRRCFFFVERAAVGVHAAIAAVDDRRPVPAAAAAMDDDIVGRVARPARPSARAIMEGTHKQISSGGASGGYCTVPWCSICTGNNPFAIADFLLCCNLCGLPLAGRPSFIYIGEKAFCKEECRSRYVVEEALREAREEKRRAAAAAVSPEKKKAAAAARKGGEECREGSIFFICADDL
uniref:FLZ-type domain-containing protein n=1 Tax=Oryza meridionalis TaxID=40149 RepID=A0A0E0EEC2_9ORYZ